MKKLKLIDGVNYVILDDDHYKKAKSYRWRLGTNCVLRNIVIGEVVTSQTLNSFLFNERRYSKNKNALDFRSVNRVKNFTGKYKPILVVIIPRNKKLPVGIQKDGNHYRVKVQKDKEIVKSGKFKKLKDAKVYLAS